jgi:hypothetical protein
MGDFDTVRRAIYRSGLDESVKKSLLERSPAARNKPLYFNLANSIFRISEGVSASVSVPPMESDATKAAMAELRVSHREFVTCDLRSVLSLASFLTSLSVSELYLLCGFRKTPGSEPRFPPGTRECLDAARAPFTAGKELSVCGRALSKHGVRAPSSFWSLSPYEGRAGVLNAGAERAIERVINSAVWWNVFALPHDILAFEIRAVSLYGVRWEVKAGNVIFRGFLEPPMPDGHEKGWRH